MAIYGYKQVDAEFLNESCETARLKSHKGYYFMNTYITVVQIRLYSVSTCSKYMDGSWIHSFVYVACREWIYAL